MYDHSLTDLKQLKQFWERFKIPLPDGAMEWINTRLAQGSEKLSQKDQEKIAYFICYAHLQGPEVLQADYFKVVNDIAPKIVYAYQFDQDVERLLTTPKDE